MMMIRQEEESNHRNNNNNNNNNNHTRVPRKCHDPNSNSALVRQGKNSMVGCFHTVILMIIMCNIVDADNSSRMSRNIGHPFAPPMLHQAWTHCTCGIKKHPNLFSSNIMPIGRRKGSCRFTSRDLVLNLRGGGSGDKKDMSDTNHDNNPRKKRHKKKSKSSSSKSNTHNKPAKTPSAATATKGRKPHESVSKSETNDNDTTTPTTSSSKHQQQPQDPIIAQIEISIMSIGCGMGATDFMSQTISTTTKAKSSLSMLLKDYFWKSHSGLYGLQSIFSLLTIAAGTMTCFLAGTAASTPGQQQQVMVLLKRTLVFASLKYMLGLFVGSAMTTSKGIRRIGLRQTRQLYMTPLIQSSNLSKRLFYSLIILWGLLPTTTTTTTSEFAKILHVLPILSIPLLLVGPILLQEFASFLLGLSDVLSLVIQNSKLSHDDTDESSSPSGILPLVAMSRALVETGLGLWVGASPKVWKNKTLYAKQHLVSQRTMQYSSILELMAGLYMIWDVFSTLTKTLFLGDGGNGLSSSTTTTTKTNTASSVMFIILRKLVCTKLYVSYCLSNVSKTKSTTSRG